jgi:hypothetical protein
MPQFPNPIEPKMKKEIRTNPWDFRCPKYDERTSCYTSAGSHYGIGYNNPVGHQGPVKQRVSTMPFDHKLGMQTDEMPRKMLNPEFLE